MGQKAETLAYQFLQKQGLILIEQNFYCYFGEIDLIMNDQEDIVFVEVRSRSRNDYGSALESINHKKITKLRKTAKYFLQQKKCLYSKTSRFDVVTVDRTNEEGKINWIKNAFWIENHYYE